jgi:hypothetical protein
MIAYYTLYSTYVGAHRIRLSSIQVNKIGDVARLYS